MAKCSKVKGHKYQAGGYDEYGFKLLSKPKNKNFNKYIVDSPSLGNVANNLGYLGTAVNVFDTLQDIGYNLESPMGNTEFQDIALRGTAQDRHFLNQTVDLGINLINGIGNLFGLNTGLETSADRELKDAISEIRDNRGDFSEVNNSANLLNTWNSNMLQNSVTVPKKTNPRAYAAANVMNAEIEKANENTIQNFYDQALKNQQREQRQAMMNYFDNGGSLDGLNGVTHFNVGGTHSENPNAGIQQGIASDGNPNLVEQDEIKYKDYIYSARLKPSKSLLDKYNLPDKYTGLSFAEIGDKLQKESEDRPNDPISLQTLNDWMSRLAGAQEEYKAKATERKLAKMIDNMSTEEKAAIMSSLAQPMMQEQEDIDLSQPMYAKGGKIYIKPSHRGRLTELKKRTGKTEAELWKTGSPATRKMITFARNSRKWKHEDGGHLFQKGGDEDYFNYTDIYGQPRFDWEGYYNYLNEETPVQTLPEGFGIAALANNTTKDINLTTPNAKRINLANLRYAPAIGAGLGALTAVLQPKDFTLTNQLREIASEYKPIAAPHIGGYRKYTPYDVNLGDAENLALEAAALRANRGLNRATQIAANVATINAFKEANAKRNFAVQQANEANRLATDTYNLGIDQFNAQRDTQYDQLNQQILANRLRTLMSAAEAEDASKTAWAQNVSGTTENWFNQLGNVGRDEWNRLQMLRYLKNLGYEGIV